MSKHYNWRESAIGCAISLSIMVLFTGIFPVWVNWVLCGIGGLLVGILGPQLWRKPDEDEEDESYDWPRRPL
jgi:hypothetical protein